MIKNIYIGLHVKYPLYLSDFNDTEFSWQFLIHNQISNFMEICPVRAEFFSANGQTDIMKLIVTFFSFANVPKNLFQKNTQYFPKIQWLFLVCVCVVGGHQPGFMLHVQWNVGVGMCLCSVVYNTWRHWDQHQTFVIPRIMKFHQCPCTLWILNYFFSFIAGLILWNIWEINGPVLFQVLANW